jgi:hypothetical protein
MTDHWETDDDFDIHVRQRRMIARCRAWLVMVEEVNAQDQTVEVLNLLLPYTQEAIAEVLSNPRDLTLDMMADIVFAVSGKSVLVVLQEPETAEDTP